MTNSGFVQILHDLLRHPSFISAPPAYRCVLITIIDRACYSPCQQDDHGILIDLLPGQFLCTERELAKLANVERNEVQRAIKRFKKINIVSQEVKHKKMVLTITWGLFSQCAPRNEPRSEPRFLETKTEKVSQEVSQKVSQERAIKEEDNNKNQHHPKKLDDDDVLEKKVLKRRGFAAKIEEKFPCFDTAFINSLIRDYSIVSVSLAVDEFDKADKSKIKNPKGLLTKHTKTFHIEEKYAAKFTNK